MKRVLIFCVVVGLFAGQASAAMYTMDVATAINLRDVSWSDTVSTQFGTNILKWVGYNPGGTTDRVYGTPGGTYGENMFYEVGFVGDLTDTDSDNVAWVQIGALADTGGVLTALQGLGEFDSFTLPISNDNDDGYEYKLYVDDGSAIGGNIVAPWETSWTTTIGQDTQTTLTLNFTEFDFASLVDIGFMIKLSTKNSDDLHTSVVPVPAAVILGVLGLGVVGLKLRKYA